MLEADMPTADVCNAGHMEELAVRHTPAPVVLDMAAPEHLVEDKTAPEHLLEDMTAPEHLPEDTDIGPVEDEEDEQLEEADHPDRAGLGKNRWELVRSHKVAGPQAVRPEPGPELLVGIGLRIALAGLRIDPAGRTVDVGNS
jgi:hypothetical protein